MEIILDLKNPQLSMCWQATITLQDSCHEVQKFLLQEGERPQLRTLASLQVSRVTVVSGSCWNRQLQFGKLLYQLLFFTKKCHCHAGAGEAAGHR